MRSPSFEEGNALPRDGRFACVSLKRANRVKALLPASLFAFRLLPMVENGNGRKDEGWSIDAKDKVSGPGKQWPIFLS